VLQRWDARRSMITGNAAPSSAAPFHLDCDRRRLDWRALRRCPSWSARSRCDGRRLDRGRTETGARLRACAERSACDAAGNSFRGSLRCRSIFCQPRFCRREMTDDHLHQRLYARSPICTSLPLSQRGDAAITASCSMGQYRARCSMNEHPLETGLGDSSRRGRRFRADASRGSFREVGHQRLEPRRVSCAAGGLRRAPFGLLASPIQDNGPLRIPSARLPTR
jgi:hypothetical protein